MEATSSKTPAGEKPKETPVEQEKSPQAEQANPQTSGLAQHHQDFQAHIHVWEDHTLNFCPCHRQSCLCYNRSFF
jgi:hypothetical protein